MAKKIGVLALQGGFAKHLSMIGSIGAEPREVRTAEDLDGLDGLIIPGGESTTIGKLLVRYGIAEKLEARIAGGLAVYGTCAGMILLAREIVGRDQYRIGAMDITVTRNAYGRQIDSFEADIELSFSPGKTFPAVFIRAPMIEKTGTGVEILASFEGVPILVRSGKILAGSFHPELTDDDRVHRYFLSMIPD